MVYLRIMSDKKSEISLKEQVANLPLLPGCYLFSNARGEVIYVGKAKNLRRRVSSYFLQSRDHTPKVRAMVRHIASLRHIVVDSETDALLLENSLIKTLQPRYNILLKDDKTYPWIVLRNEPFPRVMSTRQVVRDGSQYFGPYGSVAAQHSVLEFLREAVPLRTCKLNLSPEMIARGRYSPCLQYHIGNCKAPCIGAQSPEEYGGLVSIAVSVLKGDVRPVRKYLEEEMARAAEQLRFETAQRFKARLEALEKYCGRSVIVSANIADMDVFSLLEDGDEAYCNFLRVRNGSVVAVHTVRLTAGVDADGRSMLTLGIQHVVENIAGELSEEVLVPFLPHTELFPNVRFKVPKRGEKHELLEFSQRSALAFRAEQLKNLELKTGLCEATEELAAQPLTTRREWNKASDKLLEIQKTWKTIGFAPKKDNNRIYERFRTACDRFFEAKRQFYAALKVEMEHNLQLKNEICEAAESLSGSEEWKKTTDELIALQARWKQIGAVARRHSDAVWKRFRAACDKFFERKAAHFAAVDGEYEENLRRKLALLDEMAAADVHTGGYEVIRDFQRRWSEIGFVPIKQKETIQKKYKAAVDELFNVLRGTERDRSMGRFREKISSMKGSGDRRLRSERERLYNKVRQLEQEIALLENNIGFFAKSKNAESLVADVRAKIDRAREEMAAAIEKVKLIDRQESDEKENA